MVGKRRGMPVGFPARGVPTRGYGGDLPSGSESHCSVREPRALHAVVCNETFRGKWGDHFVAASSGHSSGTNQRASTNIKSVSGAPTRTKSLNRYRPGP